MTLAALALAFGPAFDYTKSGLRAGFAGFALYSHR
jgi:hypothetical protein